MRELTLSQRAERITQIIGAANERIQLLLGVEVSLNMSLGSISSREAWINKVFFYTEAVTGVTKAEILSKSQAAHIIRAKHIVMVLLRERLDSKTTSSTVGLQTRYSAEKAVTDHYWKLKTRPIYRTTYEGIKSLLGETSLTQLTQHPEDLNNSKFNTRS